MTIRRRNLLPSIYGRVCPVEHQCESRCVLLGRQDPVGIDNDRALRGRLGA